MVIKAKTEGVNLKDGMKTALVAAGFDPSGGAGVLLDTKVFSRFGLHACAVITANTVQNSCGAKEIFPIPSDLFVEQLEFLKEDFSFSVLKVGMLGRGEFLENLFERFPNTPKVVDPVMFSKNGTPLVDNPDIYRYYASEIDLLTPNVPEAKYLAGEETDNPRTLLERLRSLGFKNVLLKGGHSEGNTVRDYLLPVSGEVLTYERKRLGVNPRGTGCALSSAMAALYVLKGNWKEAFLKAESFMDWLLQRAGKVGRCHEIFVF